MRSGELFAGVGGLGMAVDAVFGTRPAWFAEVDTAPSKVLAYRHPDVPNLGDVTKVDWPTTPRVQVLAGGFPCQDVSLAGRRKGMAEGTRSGLWSEFAKAIDEQRPDWIVIENVRGLLSAGAAVDLEPCPLCVGDDTGHVLRALGAVLGDLADLGFDAEWTGVRASDVGAPHGRFRVFILAWPAERTVADAERGGRNGRSPEQRRAPEDPPGDDLGHGETMTLLPTPIVSDGTGGPKQLDGARFAPQMREITQLLPTPDAYSGSRGGSQHPDKRRDGGHTVSLADVTEHALMPTPRAADGNGGVYPLDRPANMDNLETRMIRVLPTTTAMDANASGGSVAANKTLTDAVVRTGEVGDTDWGPYADAIARWERVLGRPAPAPVRHDGKGGKPRLNPELTEWMMGWPAGHVTDPDIGLTRSEQLKACGNGVVPQQAAAALRELLARDGVPSIREAVAA